MTKEKLVIDPQGLYYRGQLETYLKEMNLPHSHPTILKYEKEGVIPSPRSNVMSSKVKRRVYTGQEIIDIAEIIKSKMLGTYEANPEVAA